MVSDLGDSLTLELIELIHNPLSYISLSLRLSHNNIVLIKEVKPAP